MSLTALPSTDPTSILRYRDGLYAVDFLTAAIAEFDFFTWLAANPGTPDEICKHFGWAEQPADVLVTLCKANEFVAEDEDGTVRTTRLADEHLVAGSPWSLARYYESLKDRPVAKDFVRVLKTGKTAQWQGHDDAESDWHDAMEADGFAEAFTAAMDCRGVYLGKALADALAGEIESRNRVLDIGGGSGVYACALAANYPHLSASVMEQPPVDRIAREKIAERGLSDRVDVVVADMFEEEFPGGHDVHLFSNVMHDWDIPEVEKLLAHSHATLPESGLIIVHETFLNEDKSGPLPVAEYSCILVHSTRGRCYGHGEMSRFLEAAGFREPRYFDTAGDRGAVIARR